MTHRVHITTTLAGWMVLLLVVGCAGQATKTAASDRERTSVAVPADEETSRQRHDENEAVEFDEEAAEAPGAAPPDPSAEGRAERVARKKAQRAAAEARTAERQKKREERRARAKAAREKRAELRKAKKKAKKKAKRRPIRRRAAARFVLSENPPDPPTGVLVRVHRRSITSGIIRVHDEYHPNESMAASRTQDLLADGWRSWPPAAAPDLSNTIARANPEFRECPFLLEVSQMPKDWLVGAGRFVSCQQSVADLEAALQREYAIDFHRRSAEPCRDLINLSLSDLQTPAMSPLKKRCEHMGVDLRPVPPKQAARNER